MKKFLSITSALLLTTFVLAQNVGISETNSPPDPSAMLDIKSTERGLLIPRLTSLQRSNISSPANGLLVYDNTTQSFWYFNTVWTELGTGNDDQVLTILGSDISIENGNTISLPVDQDSQQLSLVGTSLTIENGNTVSLPADQDSQQLSLVGTSITIDNGNTIILPTPAALEDADGDTRIQVDNGLDNDKIEFYAGSNITPIVVLTPNRLEFTTASNLRIGSDAGGLYTAGSSNTMVGQSVAMSMTGGSYNTFIGRLAGKSNSGDSNTFVGAQAGESNSIGSGNTIIGDYAAHTISSGSGNTILGTNCGNSLSTGSGNVFIGNNVASSSNVSNKLYIDNSNGDFPLILGDFSANTLQINGTLSINGLYTLPSTLGSSGQVLISDGSGQAQWGTPSGGTPQTLSIVGNQLSISAGNSVTIPLTPSVFEAVGTLVSQVSGESTHDFVFGSTSLSYVADANYFRKFQFDKDKGAFRAGSASSTQWNATNTGDYSFAGGLDNTASGYCSTSFGTTNNAAATTSTCIGSHLQTNATTCFAVGRYNIGSGQNTWVSSDPLFEIGNGSNEATRKNALTVLKNGKVIIGYEGSAISTIGAGYDLVVDGPVLCEEVRVQDSGAWPDYVFDESYSLMSFDELREYIAAQNHLPGVPAAAAVNGNGYDLGAMNEILLEKIEELHLYLLQLEAKITELQTK